MCVVWVLCGCVVCVFCECGCVVWVCYGVELTGLCEHKGIHGGSAGVGGYCEILNKTIMITACQ